MKCCFYGCPIYFFKYSSFKEKLIMKNVETAFTCIKGGNQRYFKEVSEDNLHKLVSKETVFIFLVHRQVCQNCLSFFLLRNFCRSFLGY